MKKVVLFLTIITLIFPIAVLVSCQSEETTTPPPAPPTPAELLVGTWEMAEGPFGLTTIEYRADGTYRTINDFMIQSGRWSIDENNALRKELIYSIHDGVTTYFPPGAEVVNNWATEDYRLFAPGEVILQPNTAWYVTETNLYFMLVEPHYVRIS